MYCRIDFSIFFFPSTIPSLITSKDALKSEADFFNANYPSLAHRCGVPFLSRTLNKVLMLHIRKCLPDLKQRIRSLLVGGLGGSGVIWRAGNNIYIYIHFTKIYISFFTSS